jgi:hypothetical protein
MTTSKPQLVSYNILLLTIIINIDSLSYKMETFVGLHWLYRQSNEKKNCLIFDDDSKMKNENGYFIGMNLYIYDLLEHDSIPRNISIF